MSKKNIAIGVVVLSLITGGVIFQDELKFIILNGIDKDYTASVSSVTTSDQNYVKTQPLEIQKGTTGTVTNKAVVNDTSGIKGGPVSNTGTVNVSGVQSGILEIIDVASARSAVSYLRQIDAMLAGNFAVLASNYTSPSSWYTNLITFPKTKRNTVWPEGVKIVLDIQDGQVSSIQVNTPECVKSVEKTDIKSNTSLSSIVEGLKKTGGDCLVLATVKSIIPFMGVPMSVWSKDGGKTIDRDFMDSVARGGGVTENGSGGDPEGAIRRMHENFQNPSLKFVCEEVIDTENGVNGFCSSLATYTNDASHDCSMVLEGPKGDHDVRVTKVTKTRDGCEIENEDTGQQGDSDAHNTPANPGNQKWSLGTGGFTLMSTPKPREKKIYNSYKFNKAYAVCCAVEAR